PGRVLAPFNDAGPGDGLAHVPGAAPSRVGRAQVGLSAAHGGERCRHAHGLDRKRDASARLPRRAMESPARRAPECRPRDGTPTRPALEPRVGRRRHRLHLGHGGGVSLMNQSTQTDRMILISADGHAGGNHEQYRAYLESKYLQEFDAWRERYRNPFKDL